LPARGLADRTNRSAADAAMAQVCVKSVASSNFAGMRLIDACWSRRANRAFEQRKNGGFLPIYSTQSVYIGTHGKKNVAHFCGTRCVMGSLRGQKIRQLFK
jgi:hypothetical protein